jgi:hypothetical protein
MRDAVKRGAKGVALAGVGDGNESKAVNRRSRGRPSASARRL